jgi:hypothetical protein
MKVLYLLFFLSVTVVVDASTDRFNYGETDLENGNYGPADWDKVDCHDLETCVSRPKQRVENDLFLFV